MPEDGKVIAVMWANYNKNIDRPEWMNGERN
jgi:hypothetical protein